MKISRRALAGIAAGGLVPSSGLVPSVAIAQVLPERPVRRFTKTVRVSGLMKTLNSKGAEKEMAYQKVKAAREIGIELLFAGVIKVVPTAKTGDGDIQTLVLEIR